MRKIHYLPGLLSFAAFSAQALAQQEGAIPVILPTQSSVYNQNTVSLPAPPPVHGQDIVRGASGISCQSAIASGGPYMDVGVIGSQDVFDRSTGAVYGRIVVPLGERPDRPDCTELYELEISRLKLELDLLRMGLPAEKHAAALAPVQQSVQQTIHQSAPDSQSAKPAPAPNENEKSGALVIPPVPVSGAPLPRPSLQSNATAVPAQPVRALPPPKPLKSVIEPCADYPARNEGPI